MRFDWIDSPGTIERPCPVCGANGAKPVRLTVDAESSGQPRLQLLDCPGCGSAFYDNLNHPAYDAARFGEGFCKFYVELGAGVDTMVDPLYRIDVTGVMTYLEIGCGFGFSLDFARFAFGWTVKGMDPSPLAAAGRAVLGLDIDSAYLVGDTAFGTRFDVVLCSEVLEHLPAPAELIRQLARTVSDDGALILTTPNVRSLHKDGPPADTLSILAPGFHLILYSPESLELILRQNGFSHVRVWEHANSLHAVAAHRPRATHDEAAVDPDVFRRYLSARSTELQPDSPVASGLSYRLYKILVSNGMFRDADEVYKTLRDSVRRVYGIDIDAPSMLTLETATAPTFEEFAQRYPFNLSGTLFFKGLCEFVDRRDYARAIEYFRAAFRVGAVISAQLSSIATTDCETENILCQARIHILYGLAAVDAPAAVAEFHPLCDPHPSSDTEARPWRLPVSLIDPTRKELFVRLVRGGAYGEANILLPDLAATLPNGSKNPVQLKAALKKLAHDPVSRLARLRLQVAVDNLVRNRYDDLSGSWRGTIRVIVSALGRRLHRFVGGTGP